MLNDDVIFDEVEKIIEMKRKRYQKALNWEEDNGGIVTRVTQLEDSLIDAYLKYLKMKYYVREKKFGSSANIENEIEEFIEIVGEE